MRIYIEAADDIDQVAARAKEAGITLTREPHTTEWGARAFEVTDPSGFALTIASPGRNRPAPERGSLQTEQHHEESWRVRAVGARGQRSSLYHSREEFSL